VWDVPKLNCPICYHPDNPEGYSRNHLKERGSRKPKCPNKESVCSLCHKNDHRILECGMEFKHQRVATQAHFSVAQSSLSEGALATLGGIQPTVNAAASVVESVHSTTQIRPFGNDDGMLSSPPTPSHHFSQTMDRSNDQASWVTHTALSTSIALLLSLGIAIVVEGTHYFRAHLQIGRAVPASSYAVF
jgi:hypothetical protein